jgi:hypothetical protein
MTRSTASTPAAPHGPNNDANAGAPEQRAREDAAALAGYIADMASELAQLAARAEMPMVAYFLDLARVEAETRSREVGENAVSGKE